MELLKIDAGAVDEVIESNEQPCLVVVSKESCHICEMVLPRVREIAKKLAGKARFYYVDVSENKDILKKYSLKGVPQILFFKEGAFCGKLTGNVEEENIEEKIAELF